MEDDAIDSYKKIMRNPKCLEDIKNAKTAQEKILVGLVEIYDGFENVPDSALKIVRMLEKK